MTNTRRGLRNTTLAAFAGLALATPAGAHPGALHTPTTFAAGGAVKLRSCWMTVAYVPRPAAVLLEAFRRPPDLTRTFYGSDPLLGVWALSCEQGRISRKGMGRVILSLVAVPVETTHPGAPPLANFLSHGVIRVDTSSRRLAATLRRAGLPARLAPRARYTHSPSGTLPFTGVLAVPGKYRLRVPAAAADPTNPHDHRNEFEYRGRRGRPARLGLSTNGAFDRFCITASGGCTARVRAARGSRSARLLGGISANARVGFDHSRLARVDLTVPGRR